MLVLLDSNVVLDFILKRPDFFSHANELFVHVQTLDYEAYVSPITPINSFYTARKAIGKAAAFIMVEALLAVVHISPTYKTTMIEAL